MNEQMKQELIEWGVDWKEVSERFMGKDELIEKFMLKFLNDASFAQLQKGLEEKDVKEAFEGCHSLKGVGGNLGLQGFLPDVLTLTEILRTESLDGSEELFERIKKSYDELIGILKKYA
ncbi:MULTISPECIES: Hpt domain-containing protein [unclassified Butyrivibrio]|uniref:Hpt domain-containing protein n=1 Tax=unclassified Butyrivibrio TaxID=2639466 RepID=UPI0004010DC8|nr:MULTISPECIES: Hpt domain-containing protein [unclassified Butyrivibrio]